MFKLAAKALLKDSWDNGSGFNRFGGGGLNSGGLVNPASGQGTQADKSKFNFFAPTLVSSRTEIETIIVESWAAKRFIYLPVDMMFIRPRTFEGADDDAITKGYAAYLSKFKTTAKLANALKAARAFGSAFMIFVTCEAPLDEPLNINELQKGDLKNILVFDRFTVTPYIQNLNFTSTSYFEPEVYQVYPRVGKTFQVHASRVLRFDGQTPLTSDGWQQYDIYYGVSELIPVLESIYQEAQSSGGISQLLAEVSVPIFKTAGFKDLLGAMPAPDRPSVAELASSVNRFKSIYNAIFMDTEDEMTRQEASLTGVADVLNFFASRLAAAAGIPATVFLGKSPVGMNATGDSDLEINASAVASMQQDKLVAAYDFIDLIMTKTGGVSNEFTYEFPSLLDQSEQEQVTVASTKATTAVNLSNAEIISTDEARKILDGDPILGQFDAEQPSFKAELQQAKQEKAQQFLAQQEQEQPDQAEQKDTKSLKDKILNIFKR